MKEYVQRCFTACESEEDKDRTEKLLKEVLQARLQDGTAYTIDWSREPLPGSVATELRGGGRVSTCWAGEIYTLGSPSDVWVLLHSKPWFFGRVCGMRERNARSCDSWTSMTAFP